MIKNLVFDLPEIYQPIYGHPELSGQVARACTDRLDHILRIHNALQVQLNRPVRVLDLGCAQGYFSLSLAAAGAEVYGVDYLNKNISVCKCLAQENPSLNVVFEENNVEAVISELEDGQYDLVLGLSVLHHIIHERGMAAVKLMLEALVIKSGVLVLELALRDEPLYWGVSQPPDPCFLLDGVPFYYEIARHKTHLSEIARPLCVASDKYWVLGDEARHFDSWTFDSHALVNGAHLRTRKYFLSNDSVMKMYSFEGIAEYNKVDFHREVQFLQQPPPDFPAAALISFVEGRDCGCVAMQRLPGTLLLTMLQQNDAVINRHSIILSILNQLVVLEASGLYHNDVRTWNVMLGEHGEVHLIDYGSISAQMRDCVWPESLFLSFFILIREICTGVVDDPNPLRTVSISPFTLPEPYRNWAMKLWECPIADWSFQLMYRSMLSMSENCDIERPLQRPMEEWMKAIEDALQGQKNFMQQLSQTINISKSNVHLDKAFELLGQAQSHSEQLVQELQASRDSEAKGREQLNQAFELLGQAQSHREQLVQELQVSRDLVGKHKIQLEQVEAEANQKIISLNYELEGVHQANHNHWKLLEQTRNEFMNLQHTNHLHWLQTQHQLKMLDDIHKSNSWRVTAPLRWLSLQWRLMLNHGLLGRLKALFKRILKKLHAFISSRPNLKSRIIKISKKTRLFWIVKSLHEKLKPPNELHNSQTEISVHLYANPENETEILSMPPRAQHFFSKLKFAIDEKMHEDF